MRELERLKTSLNHQWPPIGAPMNPRREEPPWKSRFDDSINAVSFGFVATAILISMFIVMAIFERLVRTTTSSNTDSSSGRVGFNGSAAKLGYQSPKMTVYKNGVSVLMPGDDMPTFIAHPVPCPPQHISHSHHQHSSSRDSSNSNSIQEY